MLASIMGYNKEQIIIRDIDNEAVYVEVIDDVKGIFKGWVTVRYEIVEDGIYNQSVKDIDLPYIVVRDNVYSISDFKIWETD